jgi:hypothetical protein
MLEPAPCVTDSPYARALTTPTYMPGRSRGFGSGADELLNNLHRQAERHSYCCAPLGCVGLIACARGLSTSICSPPRLKAPTAHWRPHGRNRAAVVGARLPNPCAGPGEHPTAEAGVRGALVAEGRARELRAEWASYLGTPTLVDIGLTGSDSHISHPTRSARSDGSHGNQKRPAADASRQSPRRTRLLPLARSNTR